MKAKTGGQRSRWSHGTKYDPEYTPTYTHVNKKKHPHSHTQALTWMTELDLLMILLSPMKAAEAEEKQTTCCPLCCKPKLLYQTLPGSQLRDNLRLNYNKEFFFFCAECVNCIGTYFSHRPPFIGRICRAWNGFLKTMEPVAFGRRRKPAGGQKASEWRNTKEIFKWRFPNPMTLNRH